MENKLNKKPVKKKTAQQIVDENKKVAKPEEYKTSIEKLTQYATSLFQNANVGMQSINDILPRTKCQHLRAELQNEYIELRKIKEEVCEFAHAHGVQVKENNFFEKSRMWLSVKMGTLFNRSTRHIAELMTVGTVMGLNQCYKDRADYQQVSHELDKISDKLELIFENNYATLKTFLRCEKYDNKESICCVFSLCKFT